MVTQQQTSTTKFVRLFRVNFFSFFRGIQSPREVEVVFLGNVILLEADKNSLRAQRRLVSLNKLQLPNRA